MTPNIHTERAIGAIVIGRAGMDLYPLPDGASIANAQTLSADLGGSAGNIAVALARAGAQCQLASVLSEDAVGAFVRNKLHEYGVGTQLLRYTQGDPRTSLALAESRNDAQVVIYRNNAADLTFQGIAVDVFAQCAVLIITGTALLTQPSRDAVMAALHAARAQGTYIIFDLDYRAYGWADPQQAREVYRTAAAECDLIVGNNEEFAVLGDGPTTQHLALGPSLLIEKRGAQGAQVYGPEQTWQQPVFNVDTLKPFGAGDAFLGNLTAVLLKGAPLADAMRRGAAAAAMVVAQRGCASAMPSTEQLETFLTKRQSDAHPTF